MSNYYNLDGIVTALKKEIDVDTCLLAKWKEVTFPRKKDGQPFQTMSKNVSGASLHRKSYAMQQGENESKGCICRLRREKKTMKTRTMRIITHDPVTKKDTVYFTFQDDTITFCNIMQYLIDSTNNPKKFLLVNADNGVCYDAYKIATERYHIRKRTFSERMNNIITAII